MLMMDYLIEPVGLLVLLGYSANLTRKRYASKSKPLAMRMLTTK
jgi:hypothetical protein